MDEESDVPGRLQIVGSVSVIGCKSRYGLGLQGLVQEVEFGVLGADWADASGGVAECEPSGGDVLGDYAAGTDYGSLTDGHVVEDGNVRSKPYVILDVDFSGKFRHRYVAVGITESYSLVGNQRMIG